MKESPTVKSNTWCPNRDLSVTDQCFLVSGDIYMVHCLIHLLLPQQMFCFWFVCWVA